MIVPLNTQSLGSLKPEEIGNGSGIFNLMRNVGGSVGISLVTTLAQRAALRHQVFLAGHATPYDSAYQSRLHAASSVYAMHSGAYEGHHQALGAMYNTVAFASKLGGLYGSFRRVCPGGHHLHCRRAAHEKIQSVMARSWLNEGDVNMNSKLLVIPALAAFLAGGCAVGPDYHPPRAGAPAHWSEPWETAKPMRLPWLAPGGRTSMTRN